MRAVYEFKCDKCGQKENIAIEVRDFERRKNEVERCGTCGDKSLRYSFNASSVAISFAGDAWADKNYKEKAYRKGRSQYLARRQSENNRKPELMPNYKGEVVSSWREAQEAAASEGKRAETYEPLIRRGQG